MKLFYPVVCATLLCAFSVALMAQPPSISFQNQNLTGVASAVDLVSANDGSNRMFIVQQDGIIRSWNRSLSAAPAVFMNIGATGANRILFSGEQGLLSLVFHPSYNGTTNRFFFLYYVNTGGDIEVARFETTSGNPNTGDASTYTPIITIPHPGRSNHNGGKLNFGTDGYLYFATGDGGGSNDPDQNAQDGQSLLGKMIRIDINAASMEYGNYSVPVDNPFPNGGAVDKRIYALGLRNPFRWSFDRANGDMWIGDVGQSAREEIDYRASGTGGGANFGWRCYEGTIPNPSPSVPACTPAGQILPIFEYNNPAQGHAVTGGYVYRGSEYPGFQGYYIAVDYVTPNIFLVWPDGSGGWNNAIQTGIAGVAGFGEAEDGTLYAVAGSSVLKVVAVGGTVLPVRLISFNARKFNNANELKWVTGYEHNTARFHIEYSLDGRVFTRAGVVTASRIELGSSYSYTHVAPAAGIIYYRLAIEDDDGTLQYSSILQVQGENGNSKIYPTIIRDNTLSIVAAEPALSIQLISSTGAIVYTKPLGNFTGSMSIGLPALPKGIYIGRMTTKTGVVQVKLMLD